MMEGSGDGEAAEPKKAVKNDGSNQSNTNVLFLASLHRTNHIGTAAALVGRCESSSQPWLVRMLGTKATATPVDSAQ